MRRYLKGTSIILLCFYSKMALPRNNNNFYHKNFWKQLLETWKPLKVIWLIKNLILVTHFYNNKRYFTTFLKSFENNNNNKKKTHLSLFLVSQETTCLCTHISSSKLHLTNKKCIIYHAISASYVQNYFTSINVLSHHLVLWGNF